MDDVRGLFLGMPHGTTPAAVTTSKSIIMSSFMSSRDVQKKEGVPDSCFGDKDMSFLTLLIRLPIVHGFQQCLSVFIKITFIDIDILAGRSLICTNQPTNPLLTYHKKCT